MTCWRTHPIEQLQSKDTSFARTASFRWMGTIIYLAEMSHPDGGKSISVRVGDAKPVELSHDGRRATWIISKEDSAPGGAGASITCGGCALTATPESTSR